LRQGRKDDPAARTPGDQEIPDLEGFSQFVINLDFHAVQEFYK
jgi:hypothetical protein